MEEGEEYLAPFLGFYAGVRVAVHVGAIGHVAVEYRWGTVLVGFVAEFWVA
jgi:hypothetical protein